MNLHHAFAGPERFGPADPSAEGYEILPLRFTRLDERGRHVVTNLAGEHVVLAREDLYTFLEHRLPAGEVRDDLQSRHLLAERGEGASRAHLDLLAAKFRSRQAGLAHGPGLHLFVVTLRCEHSCRYCQVSRVSADRAAFDMDEVTAERAVDLLFQAPSPTLKVEFQGGEPLLNFPLVRRVVEMVEARNRTLARPRNVQFVVTSNLALLDDEVLDFAGEHDLYFSTSLDGPAALHNANRPRPGADSHARALSGIARIRERLGPTRVSALMTSTAESLTQPEAIIDEYAAQGFTSIFLRPISPYGFAVKTAARTGYEAQAFVEFYQRGLTHVLALNRRGVPMREEYSALLLRRMLTPFPTRYVDLQSPAGLGLGALVYNYDGEVYASDEGRMLAAMGDKAFRLGNVATHSFRQLFTEGPLLETLHATMAEGTPGCTDCAFLPWCGTDPLFHHRTQGDVVGHRPTSAFCARHLAVFRHLVSLLADEPQSAVVLRAWAY